VRIEAGGGWTVCITAIPTPAGESVPGLTASERDCLALLMQQDRPMKGSVIRAKLEAGGKPWSGITVKRNLARLRRAGLIDNTQKHPNGYYVPEAVLPILRVVSST
jgi:hypothetical protein